MRARIFSLADLKKDEDRRTSKTKKSIKSADSKPAATGKKGGKDNG